MERVASGELKRLMIFMPPRHSKSEMVSRLFSAYYLLRNPSHFVGINSYAADLAFTLSRAARQNFIEGGGEVKPDAAAVKHWETAQGGGMWAAGVGGPITGKGFHLGIIDDPVKNSEEANSETIREKHKEWFVSTFHTRREPDNAIIVIQTRWHEDDLSGWLLSEEEQAKMPEKWHIVCLPAIAEEQQTFPETCTVEADFRDIGDALCPERYTVEEHLQTQDKDSRTYEALYQQRPTPKTGLFFHVDKLEIVPVAPVGGKMCRGWDKGATAGGGDYTAGVKIVKGSDGIYYVADVVRGQWDTATRDRTIRQTAVVDHIGCRQKGEQEPGSGGKESAENFIKMLAGYPVSVAPSTANKQERADPFSSQVNAGNVKLIKGDWNKAFIDELRSFPLGKHDDQVDGASLAFNELSKEREWSHFESRF